MYLFFVRVRVRGVPVLYLTNSREIELHEGMYVPNNSTFHTHPVMPDAGIMTFEKGYTHNFTKITRHNQNGIVKRP